MHETQLIYLARAPGWTGASWLEHSALAWFVVAATAGQVTEAGHLQVKLVHLDR